LPAEEIGTCEGGLGRHRPGSVSQEKMTKLHLRRAQFHINE